MRRTTILASLTALLLVFSLGIILNCASGDDDDDDNDDNNDAAGNRGISAYVRDFQSKQEVQGALVELVDNSTGEAIGGDWSMTSPSGGKVSFSDIPEQYGDLIGVKVTKAGNKDTYQYDFVIGATDEEFLLVGVTTAELVATILDVTLDPAAGFAAGGIYWGDPTDENPVGCAVVQTDPVPADGIYYFGADNLPFLERSVPGDDPDNASDGHGVNPQNGYWVGMNIPPGEVDITATSGANVETSFIPRVFADSVCIANVYFSKDEFTSDPTEDWCTE